MSLFNYEEEDNSMSFLQDSKKNLDGLYRVDYKKASDPKKGYESKIRLLPWAISVDDIERIKGLNVPEINGAISVVDDSTFMGPNAIKRVMTYVKLPDSPELQGFYDSPQNFSGKCDLSTTFFVLDKSPNPVLKDRAKQLNKVVKYYSYALILEDKQQPEMEGQIVIYSFGWKIQQKIEAEWNGENAEGGRCKVYDLAEGKDLRIVVKEVGGYANYDSCFFMEKSPIKINGKLMPTEEVQFTLKNGSTVNKKIIKKDFQDKLTQFLLNRKADITEYAPKHLTDDQQDKISQIIKLLTGKPTSGSELFGEQDSTTAEELFGDTKTVVKTATKAAPKTEVKVAQKTEVKVEEDPFADLGTNTNVTDDEDPFAGLD